MQNYLPACKIVATHGVRGEMRALPLCDGAAFLAKFKRLYATPDGGGETALLGVRAQGNVLLLRLAGVEDMDAARAQVGRTWYFAKTPVPARSTARSRPLTSRRRTMSIPCAMRRAPSTCSRPCRSSSTASTSKPAPSPSGPSPACLRTPSTAMRNDPCASTL